MQEMHERREQMKDEEIWGKLKGKQCFVGGVGELQMQCDDTTLVRRISG